MRHWEFKEPVYESNFVLVHGTEAELEKFIRRKYVPSYRMNMDCDGFVLPLRNKLLIWFPATLKRKTPYWMGVVAHEALHAAAGVLVYRGIYLDQDSKHEPFAYYMQWIMEECAKRLWSR